MNDLVSAKRAGLPESLSAHFTNERPGPGVHRHVSGQIIMRVKNLWTMMTIIFLEKDIGNFRMRKCNKKKYSLKSCSIDFNLAAG